MMRVKRMGRILTAALLMVSMFAGTVFAGTLPGIGEVYYDSQTTIGPDTEYSEKVASNSAAGGIEHIYTVEANLVNGILKPYVFSGEIRGKYNLGSMIDWVEQEGYQVLAAINGDLYDTSSGTPRGPVIHSGILLGGGYAPEYSIAFTQSGKGYLSYSGIHYVMNYQKYNYVDESTPKLDENGNPVLDEEGNPVMDTVTTSYITDETRNIDFFNVPHGGANGLHLYNRHYSSTTKTSGSCVEVILTVPDVNVANLKIGETITAVVEEVKTDTSSTPIGDNQLVLSTKSGSASYSELWNMVPGSEVTITVTAAEGSLLDQAVESIGVYHILAQDGVVTTTDKTINPRTCIGIKPDGKIILYVVDGRQSSHSKGMNGVDIATYLVSLGCETVVNMDGGGSTTMFARNEPGKKDDASLVNSVSEGSMRSLANGLMLVYTPDHNMTPAHLSVLPSLTLMMPGASQPLDVYALNANYEKTTELSGKIEYSVSDELGTVNHQSTFIAGGTPGEATITAAVGDVTGTAKVQIINDFTFSTNISSLNAEPGTVHDINVVNPKYGYADVVVEERLFQWRCDANIGTIDGNGVFYASADAKGETGNITVSSGVRTVTIPVTVGKEVYFSDIVDHWAYDYIVELAKEGVISGVTETTFEPDSGLTRAQMLVLLSKLNGNVDVSTAQPGTFRDVLPNDWHFYYVYWGVESGIVSGMGDGSFAPDAPVTREQMTVMLNNFAQNFEIRFEAAPKELTFSDNHLMGDWAKPSIQRIVNEGIMSGKPGNIFDPQGMATRAEAARIIYVVKEIYEFQMMP